MKTITSELYVKSSSLTDEKICIGLFLIDGDNVYFDYSKKKLNVSARLVDSMDRNSMVHWLDGLKDKITRDKKSDELALFRNNFDEATLSYLNTYSNGVFHFSKAKTLDASVDDDYFRRLFRKLVDPDLNEKEKDKAPAFRKKVSSILRSAAFKKIDTAYSISPEVVSGIYAAHTIDFIGKNGSFLAGDAIDFQATPARIDRSLFEFDRIARGLKKLASENGMSEEGRYYAYFSQPEDAEGKKVLDLARRDKNKAFELKELDHLENLAKHIAREDFQKFSSWLAG